MHKDFVGRVCGEGQPTLHRRERRDLHKNMAERSNRKGSTPIINLYDAWDEQYPARIVTRKSHTQNQIQSTTLAKKNR